MKKETLHRFLIYTFIFTLLYSVYVIAGEAAAPAVIDAEAKWNEIIDLIIPWIARVGGLITLGGAIMIAQSFFGDNPESRSRGIQVLVGGIMVIAVAGSSSIFLT